MKEKQLRIRFRWLTDQRMTLLFLLPTLLLLLLIAIFPLIWSLRLSFTDWSVIGDAGTVPEAIGFINYRNILGLGETASQLRLGREVVDRFVITGQFVIPAVLIELVLGFGLAMLLNRKFTGRGLIMTMMLVPMMLTPVVVTLFWRYIFRTDIGVLNYFIRAFGGSNVDWLNQVNIAPWALILVDVWMWTPFMMLIALAGLSAIPKYLYEAADVDRASGWFKFRHVTLPLVTPLLLIAILFRTMDAYKLFDQVWVLTGGGPGSATQTMSFYLYQVAFSDFETGLGSSIGYIMLIVIIALANVLIRMLNQVKATVKEILMTNLSKRYPQTAHYLREGFFWTALFAAFLFFMFPLYWMGVTSVKPRSEVEFNPPTFIPFVDFEPTFNNYVDVFFKDRAGAGLAETDETAVREVSDFPKALWNSIIITGMTTVAAVLLGTFAAYAFSRFDVPGENDMLFFILSTKMLPPVVVLIPIFLMFSQPGELIYDALGFAPFLQNAAEGIRAFTLRDSYLGITLLYITFGLPFVVWMMKGFFDEIPKEYEEAAMLDGYSRLEAIWRIVLPEALPAMLATSVFVIITAWNEFIFVLLLNRNTASTVPPFLYSTIGYGQVEWGRMAATSVLFLIPLAIFTYIARNHLLRGVTFGAVRR